MGILCYLQRDLGLGFVNLCYLLLISYYFYLGRISSLSPL